MNNIIEGNKLIAKFDGLIRKEPDGTFRLPQWYRPDKDARKKPHFVAYDDSLEYHSSLDLLKPAIDKFLKIDISEFNYNLNAMSEFRRVRESLANMPISKNIGDFWNELVCAIKWYNNQNQQP